MNAEFAGTRKTLEAVQAELREIRKSGVTPPAQKSGSSSSNSPGEQAAGLTMEAIEARLAEHGRIQREIGRLENAIPSAKREAVLKEMDGAKPEEQLRVLRLASVLLGGETPQPQAAGGETPEKPIARAPDGAPRASNSGWPSQQQWNAMKPEAQESMILEADAAKDNSKLEYIRRLMYARG